MKTWIPGTLCTLLAATAAWLAWQCFHPTNAAARPHLAKMPALPSKARIAMSALTEVTPSKAAATSSIVHFDQGAWEYAFSRDHPEYLDLCTATVEEDIAVYYAPLFRMLRLAPEQRATLLRAMVEKRLASIVGRSSDAGDHAGNARNVFELWNQIDTELKGSLEPAVFSTYQWYDRIPPVARGNLAEIGEHLAFASQPLTIDQERAIWGMIESAFNNLAEIPLIAEFYETGIVDDVLLQRMGAHLSSDQLQIATATAHERVRQRKLGLHQSPGRIRY